jgi:hypothetical protein
VFTTNFEPGRGNVTGAGRPGNRFLSLFLRDLEIIIEKCSRVDWKAFPAFAHVLNREIWEFDFLARLVLNTGPVRSFLFGLATANTKPTKRMRVELFVTFRKSGSSSGMTGATRRF